MPECPLLAQSRHLLLHRICPLSGAKRTYRVALHMFAIGVRAGKKLGSDETGTGLFTAHRLQKRLSDDCWFGASAHKGV